MHQDRKEREEKILLRYPNGAIVRVTDPDDFNASVASKLRERLGEVTGHQIPTPNPIVTFYAVGRKKEHCQVFRTPFRDLEIVVDMCAIADWRDAVAKKSSTKD